MRYILTLAALAALAVPAQAQNAAPGTPGAQSSDGSAIGDRSAITNTRGEVAPIIRGTERNAGVRGPGRTAVNDALFAAAAADGGLTELTVSQLGAQRATDPELRKFSERMLEEHTQLNNELKLIATRKGIALPERLDVRSAFCAESLNGLSGQEFDHCYARAQLIIHLDSLAAFEAEAKRGLDPDMRAMAARAVPRIKAHLEMIRPIAKRYTLENENESAEHRTGSANELGRPVR